MEGHDRISKRDDAREDRELRDRVRERDELTPSPEVRAKFILDLIQAHAPNITNWDLLCFCSEYLGSQVLIYNWLDEMSVRTITQIVQTAHYIRNDIPESGVV